MLQHLIRSAVRIAHSVQQCTGPRPCHTTHSCPASDRFALPDVPRTDRLATSGHSHGKHHQVVSVFWAAAMQQNGNMGIVIAGLAQYDEDLGTSQYFRPLRAVNDELGIATIHHCSPPKRNSPSLRRRGI
eukprot:RCo006635